MSSVSRVPDVADRFSDIVDAIVSEVGGMRGGYVRGTTAKLCCPARPDQHPSLSIWIKGDSGRIGIKCHKHDCQQFEVLAAVGLPPTVLYPNPSRSSSSRSRSSRPLPSRRQMPSWRAETPQFDIGGIRRG